MRAAGLSWQSALAITVTSHVFYGVDFDYDGGRVLYVYSSEIPAGTRVAIGDRVVERANGDALRGFRLEHPRAGEQIHVVATQGTVILTAQPRRYPTSQAISEAIRETSGAAVAFGIVRRGELTAIVLYGRHEHGTELEPDELRLIRRLVDASAIAYETAEVTSLRAKNATLERQLLQLRGEIFTTPM